jgi:hypothetical protein
MMAQKNNNNPKCFTSVFRKKSIYFKTQAPLKSQESWQRPTTVDVKGSDM